MSAALKRTWTRQQFFTWAEAQEERYEFDGLQPVAMNGGTIDHDTIHINIAAALPGLLRGTGCRPLGPNSGVEIPNGAIRYPDAFVICASVDGRARLASMPVVVFEVVSPSSGRIDRIIKVREYASIPSVLQYVIVESTNIGATVLSRTAAGEAWTAVTLTDADILALPEIGAELPPAVVYEDVEFAPVFDE